MKDKLIGGSPLQSKKFLAAMLWSFAWLVLIGTGIQVNLDKDALIAMVYVCGAVQILYLGGQAAVDTFVRSAFAKIPNAPKPTEDTDASV